MFIQLLLPCKVDSFSTLANDLQGLKVLLIAGSDGSGTRGVVSILERMGISVVVDDPVSKDIHAAEVGGWPNIITPLLTNANMKHSKNCGEISFPPRADDLSPELVTEIITELQVLFRAEVSKQSVFAPKPVACDDSWVPNITLKAPISMVIAPLLLHMGIDLRLIHVVRDGRDIAFSKNQSPVVKFFNATFGNKCWNKFLEYNTTISSDHLGVLRSAYLWSKWNSKFNWWAMKAHTSLNSAKGQIVVENDYGEDNGFNDLMFIQLKFKYLLLRIEDLTSIHDKNKGWDCLKSRSDALLALAEFSGSSISKQELCCLCNEDMGSGGRSVDFIGASRSVHKDKDELQNVQNNPVSWKSGFGKWRAHVKGEQELERQLNLLTSSTLNLLGYDSVTNDDVYDFECSSNDQCNDKKTCVRALMKSTSFIMSSPQANKKGCELVKKWQDGQCEYLSHFSVMKRDIKTHSSSSSESPGFIMVPLGYSTGQAGLEQCCKLCLKNAHSCRHFTFEFITGECWLMGPPQDFFRDSGFVSGWISNTNAH